METTNGNENLMERYTKQTKKSDEKEKQPYIKGLKKSKPNRDDWKQKDAKRKWCKGICDESK